MLGPMRARPCRKPLALIKKLRKAKKEAPSGEKPEPVRTHLRNMIIVPEMIGSVIGVYNGKTFNQVRCVYFREGAGVGSQVAGRNTETSSRSQNSSSSSSIWHFAAEAKGAAF